MTRYSFHSLICGGLILASAISASCNRHATPDPAAQLVILHTNDTHSHIDPVPSTDMGGVARRKVLIDSVRAAMPNVLLVDAGDVVQGTLYFHLYKGMAEQRMINALGYDIQILGNHEFDNGTDALARMLADATPTLLASNYAFADSSSLAGRFLPWTVKDFGGRRVGIISVNLNPTGMVAEGNYDGVQYLPWQSVVQPTVDMLRRREGADLIVAVTHVGYEGSAERDDLFGDTDIAANTRGIDIIIGGHSHTMLPENLRVANAAGDSVLVVQTGRYGQYLGEITVDLNTLSASSRLIPVDARLDARRDPEIMKMIEPYRAGVDSLYVREVATVAPEAGELKSSATAMQNFAADFVASRGRTLADGIDAAITNKGGLRSTWTPGPLTEGAAIDMMPFANKTVVLEISGADLLEALAVMAGRGGDAVSAEMRVTFDP
ncbi:MAG: bifunctional metallophosphatase/5'-nucleotidase, partial [Muribaculaceae bacterium]|nr:bifunctional metallophosphatase/5'-nucleotidase [Muribaculaceae bacterium]